MARADRPPGATASMRIKLKYPDVDTFIRKYGPNISRGGIFIATRSPKPEGTLLRFEIVLANEANTSLLRGEGQVQWTRAYDPAEPTRAHGMGVKFVRLDQESQALVERVLAFREGAQSSDEPLEPTAVGSSPELGVRDPLPSDPGQAEAERRVAELEQAEAERAEAERRQAEAEQRRTREPSPAPSAPVGEGSSVDTALERLAAECGIGSDRLARALAVREPTEDLDAALERLRRPAAPPVAPFEVALAELRSLRILAEPAAEPVAPSEPDAQPEQARRRRRRS